MLTRYEQLRLAVANTGDPYARLPGAPSAPPPGPTRRVRVLLPTFRFEGRPVERGEVIECSGSDAANLVRQRRAEYAG